MKYTLLSLLMIFGMNSAFSQLAMRSTAEFEGTTEDSSLGTAFDVTNNGTEEALFFWEFETPDDIPEEWKFTICDQVLCYEEGVEEMDCNDTSTTNAIPAGNTINYYKISLNHNGVAGTYTVDYRLRSTCGSMLPEDVLATRSITYTVAAVSSTKEITSSGLAVYPNPTTDMFQINEDEGVSSVSIYNIVGREVYMDNHTSGKAHDVANLNKGMYLVKMLDFSGDEIKVLRLIKS